jgi:hypothetical protein
MAFINSLLRSKLLWGLIVGGLLGYLLIGVLVPFPPSVQMGVLQGSVFGLLLGVMCDLWLDYRRTNFPELEEIRLPKPRFRLQSLLFVTAVFGIGLAAWVNWPFVSESQRKQIRIGMSKAEVLQILGRPSSRSRTHWVWSKWPPGRVFVVTFTVDERVEESFTD